ncbi:hypothetical protein [Methylobacterium sp. C1]|uniref:hypothetical protein n=1 Tax=Methylobacterium sp. C1 TaxID=1479019 RepID=UPI00133125CC|nr:hypothetical protein [Methylobacterium sp. C1]
MILKNLRVITICLLAMAGTAEAQSPGNPQKTESQQQDANSKKAEPSPPQPEIGAVTVQPQRSDESLAETKVYEPDCGKPKSQPEADLCVQRRVADAAESALHWTRIQTGGALVGLVLVLATLGVTAWTGKAASIAAQAAVDAVGAERAWMTFEGIQPATMLNAPIGNGKIEPKIYGIAIQWKNTGRSPSIKNGITSNIQYIGKNDEIPFFENNIKEEFRSGTIGPGRTVITSFFWLPPDIWESFAEGNIDIVAWSSVKYATTFNRSRICETEVTLRISYDGFRTGENGSSSPNYATHVMGPQNDAT